MRHNSKGLADIPDVVDLGDAELADLKSVGS